MGAGGLTRKANPILDGTRLGAVLMQAAQPSGLCVVLRAAGCAPLTGAGAYPFEQDRAGLIEFLRGLDIGQSVGHLPQIIKRDVRAQEGVCIGQAGKLVQRRHDVLCPVHPPDAPGLGLIGHSGSEQTWAMEVQKWIQIFTAEGVEVCGMVLRGVFVAEQLAHHHAVLGLDQAIVVAVARTAAGELDMQLSSRQATWWLTYSLPLSAWKPRMANGNCSSICSMTGSMKASEMLCTVATTCHWVTQSTALMWYGPLVAS